MKINKYFLVFLLLVTGLFLYIRSFSTIHGDIRYPAARGPSQTICAINNFTQKETCIEGEDFVKNGLKIRFGQYTIYSTVNDEESDERWDNLVGYKAFYNEYVKENCDDYLEYRDKKEKCDQLEKNVNPISVLVLPNKVIEGIKFDWFNSREYEEKMERSKTKTEVLEYKQVEIPKQSKEGSCWTFSIASSNSRAWRCMTENYIYDPCFETDTGQVVCAIDSGIEEPFELKLTEPLPKQRNSDTREASYWLMELENGLKCYVYTGTADIVNNELVYHYCPPYSYLLSGIKNGEGGENKTIDKNGEYWTVRMVVDPYDEPSDKILPVEVINVVRVWE